MSNLELRLTDAYREATGTVRPEEIRELQIQPSPSSRPAADPRRGRSLMPLVAAAAVLAVGVAAGAVGPRLLATHQNKRHAASRERTTEHGRGAIKGLPAYIVANNGGGLAIIATATWKTVAQVPAPSGRAFTAVAGAADDQTFVVAADLSAQSSCETWLYRLRLNRQGQPASFGLLVPRMSGLPTSIAVSANAETLAYSVVHCASGATGHISGSHPIGDIGVLNLANRRARNWSFTLNEDYTSDLSLSADGGAAGFSSYLDTATPGTVQVGRVLPSSAQPGTVRQRDRVVVRSAATTNSGLDAVALSPDGHTMYACTQSGSSATVKQTLAAYDTATGRVTTVLRTWRTRDPSCGITADPTGGYLLLSTVAKSGKAGQGKVSLLSPPGRNFSGHPSVTVLGWVNLRTGSLTKLPVSIPIGAGIGL